MDLPEASCVPILRGVLCDNGAILAREDGGGEGTQGILRTNHPASLRGTSWEWSSSTVDQQQTPSATEQEAAQTLLGPVESRGLGEKQASAAGLSKQALVVWFPP